MKPATVVTIVVGALLLAGCTSGGVNAPTEPPVVDAVSTAVVGGPGSTSGIPEGTWRSVRTRDAATAAGLSGPEVTGAIGAGIDAAFLLTIGAGRFSIFVEPQRGVAEVGDLGTYEYREDGALVTTSESEGCPGCVLPISWSIDGDRLSLTLKQEGGVTTQADERFVIDGTWTRAR